MIAAALLLASLLAGAAAGAAVYERRFADQSQSLAPDGDGDKPTLFRTENACVHNACTYSDNYQWTVPAGGQISSTFGREKNSDDRTVDLMADRLRGTLVAKRGPIPRADCKDARIDWTIGVDGAAPIQGTLTGKSDGRILDIPIPADAQKITITARRTDDHSCTAHFWLDDPMLVDQRP